MTSKKEVLKQINRSGYPFQLKVEHEISQTQNEHGWYVESREHPWISPDGKSDGFIDLVLKHQNLTKVRLVVECKRIKADDSRQLRWVFLCPKSESKVTKTASCLEVEGWRDQEQPSNSNWFDARIWDNIFLDPVSLQSEFCILQNDEQRRQPILESLAGEVLESIEGLAEEGVSIAKSKEPHGRVGLFIFPAIVTNAELAVCHFDPAKIKISDGTLDIEDFEIETVPFIRFRKSLATDFPQGSFYDLQSANQARERTVFIANAKSLSDFLKGWHLSPSDNYKYAIHGLIENRNAT